MNQVTAARASALRSSQLCYALPPGHLPAGGSRLVCNGFLLNLTSLEIIALMLLTLIVHQNVFISCFLLN